MAVTVRMDSSDFRIALSNPQYSSFKKNYKACFRVMLAILSDTRWAYAKAFPALNHDSKIIELIYPELQKALDKDEVIMVDKLFDTKYRNSSPKIINGYKEKNGRPLQPYQVKTNRQIEEFRGTVEKCIGHFKNKFLRFEGNQPFAYPEVQFEPMIKIALSLDKLTFSDLQELELIAINHPFFAYEFIPEWDDPIGKTVEGMSEEDDEEFEQTLSSSRDNLAKKYPALFGKEEDFIPISPVSGKQDGGEVEEMLILDPIQDIDREDIEEIIDLPILTEKEIKKMKVKDLKKCLKERGLNDNGLKA